MGKFTFFIEVLERPTMDTPETIAMLKYRLKSIEHLQNMLDSGRIQFAFKNEENNMTYFQLEAGDPAELDRLVKEDPIWPFSIFTITPVIKTIDLINELQDHLQEYIFNEKSLSSFSERDKQNHKIDEDGEYVYVKKGDRPTGHGIYSATFSPLLPQAQQNEINRRTLYSQRLHNDPLEFNDVNPVGMPIGWNIYNAKEEYVKESISKAPISPYTLKGYVKLNTLKQARIKSSEHLQSLTFGYDI